MTNEQLIKHLEELQTLLPNKGIDNETLNEQIRTIEEEINKADDNLNKKSEAITGALNMKNQYLDSYDDATADIAESNYQLSIVDSEIDAANYLISEGKRELEKYSKQLTNTKDDNEVPILQNKLTTTRDAIAYLRDYGTQLETRKEELMNLVADSHTKIDTYSSRSEMMQKTVDNLRENHKKFEAVTLEEKTINQSKVDELRSYNNENSDKLYHGYAAELSALTSFVKEGRIDQESALNKLKEIKDTYPTVAYGRLYLNAQEELEAVERTIANYEMEVIPLREKVASEESYQVSIFKAEQLNDELDELETKVARYKKDFIVDDTEVSKIEREISEFDNSQVAISKEKAVLEAAIIAIGVELKRNRSTMTAKQIKSLEKEQNKKRKEMNSKDRQLENILIEKSLLANSLNAIKLKNKFYNGQLGRYEKLLEDKKENLSKRSEIDTFARVQDENRLRDVEDKISSLKDRRELLDKDFGTELDSLITNMGKDLVTKPDEKDTVIPIPENNNLFSLIYASANDKLKKIVKNKEFLKRVGAFVAALLLTGMNIAAGILPAIMGNSSQKDDLSDANLKNITKEFKKDGNTNEFNFGGKKITIDYNNEKIEEEQVATKSIEELANEIVYSPNYGGWGTGQERKDKLTEAGYDADAVQKRVNEILAKTQTSSKPSNPSSGTQAPSETPKEETPTIPDTPSTPEVPNVPVVPSKPILPPIINPIPEKPEIDKPIVNPIPPKPDVPYYPDYPSTGGGHKEEITVGRDTLFIYTPEGTIAVDNSGGANAENIKDKGASTDFTASGAVTDATYNDTNSSIDITIKTDATINAPQNDANSANAEQIRSDYEDMLTEYGGKSK